MVSVIIPTHNRLIMLKRAIDSVLNQTYQQFEIIIISDGSSDNTNSFLQSCSNPKVSSYFNEISKGASHARNVGIKHAKGEYIAFLDDDDEWFNFHLEVLMKKIENSNPNVGLVYGWIDYYKNDKIIDSKYPTLKGDIFLEMLDRQPITNSSVLMIKSSVLTKIKGFDEKLLRGNDGDFIRRISKFFHVDFVPMVLCKVHVGHEDRITVNNPENLKKEISSYRQRLETFKTDFNSYPNKKANILIKISISYLKLSQFKNTFMYFLNALKVSSSLSNKFSIGIKMIKAIIKKIVR